MYLLYNYIVKIPISFTFFSGSPPLTGSGTVNIFVQDVNDHSPRFERTDYVAFVLENLPSGTEIIHIQAIDDDFGLNAKLRYVLYRI